MSTLTLVTLAAVFGGGTEAAVELVDDPVITGRDVVELRPFDDLLTSFLAEHHVPGASLAIARDGQLIYARGFGVADEETAAPVLPESLFRIASISKPITAVAVHKLVEAGALALDENPFVILGFEGTLARAGVDPRLRSVTVEHLLRHTAGWDRQEAFDPMFAYERISAAMQVPSPPDGRAIIEYMLTQPLQFDPGARYVYSNFGYHVLGRVIEQRAGMEYAEFVRSAVLAPLGITDMRIGQSLPEDRAPDEVRYYDVRGRSGPSIHDPTRTVPLPYAINHEIMDAHGAWIASASDLALFADALHRPDALLGEASLRRMFSPPPGAPGRAEDGRVKSVFYGHGWLVRRTRAGGLNCWHAGGINGSSTLLVRRYDAISWAVLFNGSASAANGAQLSSLIDPLLHRAAARVRRWPE